MEAKWHFARASIVTLLMCVRAAIAGTGVECSGPLKGLRPTPTQIEQMLKVHREWRAKTTAHAEHTTAGDFCQADLRAAQLDNADLTEVKLAMANLSQASLRGAELTGIDLRRAILRDADLSGANFGYEGLELQLPAGMPSGNRTMWLPFENAANLSGANLLRAKLTGTKLRGARLVDTDLSLADLREADLSEADLRGAIFRLGVAQQLPDFGSFTSAVNLALIDIHFDGRTIPAFQRLRQNLKTAGLRDEERGITAALHRAYDAQAGWPERFARAVLFDWTSDYGNSPGRPLLILTGMAVLFAIIYSLALAIRAPTTTGAIWLVWDDDRVLNRHTYDRERLVGLHPLQAVGWGGYFSLLSAFSIGWRDLNVGNWLTRMHPREHVLRATGWVRVASGLQSLMSVYLLALWALTYFGRPFE